MLMEKGSSALIYEAYKVAYERLKGVLQPAEVIPSGIPIVLVGREYLSPNLFRLRDIDRRPVGRLYYPGKSAHILFSDDPDLACEILFARQSTPDDHVYAVTACQIQEVGFSPFYAPTATHKLHLRLVYDPKSYDGSEQDIPRPARVALSKLFQGCKVA